MQNGLIISDSQSLSLLSRSRHSHTVADMCIIAKQIELSVCHRSTIAVHFGCFFERDIEIRIEKIDESERDGDEHVSFKGHALSTKSR